MNEESLMNKAISAMKMSYSPYSDFKVGAALLCKSGKIYTGCNIENSSYPAGICAERSAISKAVSEGQTDFTAIAIVGGKSGIITDYCTPCGICRQVLSEFCKADFVIVLFNGKETKEYTLSEMLPHCFGRKNLCE